MGEFQMGIAAKAIDYIASLQAGEAPDLDALAARFGYEATHFQKLFTQKVGISPKRMIQYLNYRRAREFLLEGWPTLEAAHAAGLSGAGRLHDLFVSIEAATPGMVKSRGAGMDITYGFHATPVGEMLIAQTGSGVCWAGFTVDGSRDGSFERLRAHWPEARFFEDENAIARAAEKMIGIWQGKGLRGDKLKLDLRGTNFQIQVWRALLKIPAGGTMNYGDIANALGDSKASRAVGTAVGANPIMLLIPCHRVIQKSGIVENYAWGSARKKIILGLEAAK